MPRVNFLVHHILLHTLHHAVIVEHRVLQRARRA